MYAFTPHKDTLAVQTVPREEMSDDTFLDVYSSYY